jgi:hypothetical protein
VPYPPTFNEREREHELISASLYTPFVGISNTDVSIINDLKQIVGIGEISLRRRILEGCKPTYDWKLISN